MDKVRCPWCGAGMELDQTFKNMMMPGTIVMLWYSCDVCGAEAPKCNSKDAVFAAAMQLWQEPLPKMWTATPASDRFRCPSDNK
jgi:hypothetical protein